MQPTAYAGCGALHCKDTDLLELCILVVWVARNDFPSIYKEPLPLVKRSSFKSAPQVGSRLEVVSGWKKAAAAAARPDRMRNPFDQFCADDEALLNVYDHFCADDDALLHCDLCESEVQPPQKLTPPPQLSTNLPALIHMFSGLHDREDGIEAMCKMRRMECLAYDKLNGDDEDVLLDNNKEPLLQRIRRKEARMGIFGTPCKTCSIATFKDDGPGPYRTRSHIEGLKNLPKKRKEELDLNNELIDLTAELCLELHYSGGAFVIENPVDRGDPTGLARRFYNKDRFPRCDEHGPLWLHPAIKRLIRKTGALFVMFDQCVLGSKFMKSTCLLVSPVLYPRLRHLWGCRCVCTELHEDVAIGKDRNGNFNSARAAAYPEAMNQLLVDVACEFFLGELGTVEEAKEKAEAYMAAMKEAADAVNHAAAEDEACRAFGRLDAEQHAAVTASATGALALVAPAGSGKTHAVQMRVRHLVERVGLAAADVLCFSFARDAAMELRQRLRRYFSTRGVEVTTFHAWCLRLLKENAPEGTCRRWPTIANETLQASLVCDAMAELFGGQWSPDDKKVQRCCRLIEKAKQSGGGIDEREAAHTVLPVYQKALSAAGAVDYADLVPMALKLLLSSPELLASARRRHVLCDESQDMCSAHRHLALLLSCGRLPSSSSVAHHTSTSTDGVVVGGLTAVGDDDQGIYGWNGAQTRFVEMLQKDGASIGFPVTVKHLLTNYRSTRPIVHASAAVVATNAHRHDQRCVRSHRGSGELVKVLCLPSPAAELQLLTSHLAAIKAADGDEALRDCAVLCRYNSQREEVEAALRDAHIPIATAHTTSVVASVSVQPYLDWLRLLANRNDDGAFLRVSSNCCGVSMGLLLKMRHHPKAKASRELGGIVGGNIGGGGADAVPKSQLSLWALCFDDNDEKLILKADSRDREALYRMRRAWGALQPLFKEPCAHTGSSPISFQKALELIASGEAAAIDEGVAAKSLVRFERFERSKQLPALAKELQVAVDQLVKEAQKNGRRGDFVRKQALLEVLATAEQESELLIAAVETGKDDGRACDMTPGVTISTIHRAKGHEWKEVWIPRLNEGEGGASGCAPSTEEVEEERRVMHGKSSTNSIQNPHPIHLARTFQRLLLPRSRSYPHIAVQWQ